MHSLYLITILQELQSLVQILPVHGDESHHHIAVACQTDYTTIKRSPKHRVYTGVDFVALLCLSLCVFPMWWWWGKTNWVSIKFKHLDKSSNFTGDPCMCFSVLIVETGNVSILAMLYNYYSFKLKILFHPFQTYFGTFWRHFRTKVINPF